MDDLRIWRGLTFSARTLTARIRPLRTAAGFVKSLDERITGEPVRNVLPTPARLRIEIPPVAISNRIKVNSTATHERKETQSRQFEKLPIVYVEMMD